ncbi:hypothetical protein D3C77_328350 [compost metagenome]
MSEQLLREILHKVSNIESDQQSMKSEMQSMKSEIQAIKETQGLMQSQLDETNTIVRAIRDRQEETDAKLDALSMDVHQLRGDFVRLKEGQERYEKILEKLSLRSIEQETDISALWRAK